MKKSKVKDIFWLDMGSMAVEIKAIDQWNYRFLGLSESGKGYYEFPQVLSLLSSVLKRTIQKNKSSLDSTMRKTNDTIDHGLRAPDHSIQSYAERIFKYSKCSHSCFILAHVYIDRYLEQPGVHLSCLNVHQLLMTSVVIATKFIDDVW
ncbi:cyclin-P3-1-like [Asparagus officinalis]|uniref:cyclin-P3-1-like n=1 Tax=Asparagus officinalis TaxID=4686 RepID=UPI00098DE2B9|nr:cyclin-P3-1-like [Asparagus officinalis]